MMSNSVGDAVDARAAGWVNRETSHPREGLRVKLQPARIASFRKPALGHDNVRFRASASELVPVDGTLFTRPDTWVTIGCLILASSTQSAQAQTRLHPSAAATQTTRSRGLPFRFQRQSRL